MHMCIMYIVHMTDQAGPQYSECPPGTKLWRLCNPVFAPEERFRFRFCKTKKKSVEGEKHEANVVGNGSSQIRGRIQ